MKTDANKVNRYADYVTIKWTAKRGGVRIPEDRLRSSLPFMGIIIPASMLLCTYPCRFERVEVLRGIFQKEILTL